MDTRVSSDTDKLPLGTRRVIMVNSPGSWHLGSADGREYYFGYNPGIATVPDNLSEGDVVFLELVSHEDSDARDNSGGSHIEQGTWRVVPVKENTDD
jgi:hypothetical protein